ncbi:MAG: dihydrodipicolinate synthase family protein [Rhodospirillales bacterium]|nr:dihydrodipicolinate synthase family protein [Rhodospirillales bacterium]
MDKRSVDWEGPCVALVTPFDVKGGLDEKAFKQNVEQCLAVGATGLLASGCTGEFWAMTNEERKRVYKACVEASNGRAPVIAGTGAIRTEDVIELSAAAKDAGCSGVMVLPPFFVKPNVEDIVSHYQAVSDAVKIPILLYNIPSATINALTPELVSRLADIDNVVAIKESSFDFNNFYRTMALAGDRIKVFGQGLQGLHVGASGSFHVHANYWDSRASEMNRAFKKGDLKTAEHIQALSIKMEDVFNNVLGINYYVGVKATMEIMGRNGGYPRLPLKPLSDRELAKMRDGFARLGLLPDRRQAAVAE